MTTGLRPLLVAAVFSVLALISIGGACVNGQKKSTWPLLCALMFCASPSILYLTGVHDDDDWLSEHGDIRKAAGIFFSGFLGSAGPALAIILYRAGIVSLGSMWCTLLCGLFVLLTAVSLMLTSFASNGDDGEDI